MKNQEKTKQQLMNEIMDLKEKILGLENLAKIDKRLKQVVGINSFNEIVDNIQETVIITNKQMEAVFTSSSCKKVTGHDLSHHQGKTVLDFVHPDDLDYVIKNAVETGIDKRGRKIEYRYQHSDGCYLWVETSGSPILDDNGEIKGAIFIGRDISERKKMEEALLQSEEKYRAIFENTGTATIFVEEDYSISLVNKEFERLSGYLKEEVVGKKKVTEFFPKNQIAKIERYHRLRRIKPEKAPPKYELKFLKRDGSLRDVLLTVDIIPGTTTSVISSLDITEIKQAQEKLFLAEEVFNNSTAGIVVTTPKGIIQRVNPAFTCITGYEQEEVIGKRACFLNSEDGDQLCKMIADSLGGGNQVKRETWVKSKDGVLYLEKSSISAIRDAQGRIIQLVKMFRDITEEEKLREEKHKVKEQTELARQMAYIITFLPDPTFVIDNDGKVVAWNKAMEVLTGTEAGSMLNKGSDEYSLYFYGYRRPLLADLVLNYDEVTAQQYPVCKWENNCLIGEKEITKPDGVKMYLWGKAALLYDPDNKIIGAIESIRDITDIKLAEKRLEESNEKYKKLVHNSSDAIFIVDAESGVVLEVNHEAEELSGYVSEELIGNHYTILNPLDQYNYKKRYEELVICREKRYGIIEDIFLITKHGRRIPVEIRANILEISGKKLIQGIIRDISERKQKEQELVKREVDHATRQAQQKIIRLKKVVAQQIGLAEIGFYSKSMNQIYQLSQRYYLDRSIPVLIQGETGTGKEIVAKLIHYGDMEEIDKPFVDINCAALSPNLFESELFGYEAGAFTGSLAKGQKGKFDIADGGTIFLDEISELPLELQVKLLRVIQDKQFYRVGGLKKISSDVRIICATNKDLDKAVMKDEFRNDLYYRLKVGYIYIPPLRERKEDILPLASMYLHQFSRQKGKDFEEFDPKAADILLSYSWPGNIRELKNVIEMSVFMHNGIELKPAHLEFVPLSEMVEKQQSEDRGKPFKNLVDELLFRTLEENQGNISRTARALGISRNTVYKKVREYKNALFKN